MRYGQRSPDLTSLAAPARPIPPLPYDRVPESRKLKGTASTASSISPQPWTNSAARTAKSTRPYGAKRNSTYASSHRKAAPQTAASMPASTSWPRRTGRPRRSSGTQTGACSSSARKLIAESTSSPAQSANSSATCRHPSKAGAPSQPAAARPASSQRERWLGARPRHRRAMPAPAWKPGSFLQPRPEVAAAIRPRVTAPGARTLALRASLFHRPIRFPQRPLRRPDQRRRAPRRPVQSNPCPEPRENVPALENPADVRQIHRLPGRPQLRADARRQHRQLLRGIRDDLRSYRIASVGGPIHQRRERRDARPRPLRRIEAMQRGVRARRPGGFEQQLPQPRRRAPAFLHPQDRAQRLARDIERAPFVAENVAPAARARCAPRRIAAEGDRARAGNHDDPQPVRRRAGQGRHGIGGHDQPPRPQHAGEDRLLVFRPAAHAEAGGLEGYGCRIEPRCGASRGKTAGDRALQLRPALGCGRMVARARLTRAEDTAGLIADHGRGAGLASVHSQEKFHGNR